MLVIGKLLFAPPNVGVLGPVESVSRYPRPTEPTPPSEVEVGVLSPDPTMLC